MCIGAMEEECFLLQVPPLHKMVVNHDMHRPLTGHRLAPRRDRSRCDALSCHIRGPPPTHDISLIHPPKPTTRLSSSFEMKLTLALLFMALASAPGK